MRRRFRLVVLNACDTARRPPAGLAAPLLAAGVAAVLAMQFPISDRAATRFADALYTSLADGEPLVSAVARARMVLADEGEEGLAWATPALFVRGRGDESLALVGRPSAGKLTLAAGIVAAGLALPLALNLLAPAPGNSPNHRPWPPAAPADPDCPPISTLPDLLFVRIPPRESEASGGKADTAFCMSTTEVTQEHATKVLGEIPRRRSGAHFPATGLTLDEARDLAHRLSIAEGATIRLPTSKEWLLAARANQSTRFHFGDDPGDLADYGNCSGGRSDGFDGRLAPVASFKANPWGLYDVHGNVAEWVDDALPGPHSVRRGGSFESVAESCSFDRPSEVLADRRESTTGLRLVREIPAARPSD